MPAAGAAEPLGIRIRAKRFPGVGAAPATAVVAELDLEVGAGEFVALTGPSGCGKTTTLNIVAGLDADFEGEIRLPAGTRTGYVFQQPRLLPWRTVEDNVRLVLADSAEASAVVEGLLAEMELLHARAVFPTRLSLGMARRVALARAFAIRPSLLLMDEPFVSLDEPTAQRLRRLLRQALARHPATVLFVTHNLREAIQLADRLVLMAPAPTRVLADLRVPLDRDARADDAAIEAFRTRLLAREDPAFRLLA